jgi:hypothetical protein
MHADGTRLARRVVMTIARIGTALLLLAASGLGGCAGGTSSDPAQEPPAQEDDLTAASAAKLGVPLSVLGASFYFKPSPQDQSGLGIVIAENSAFAFGATSEALPDLTSLDRKPFAPLVGARVSVHGVLPWSFDAFFDFAELTQDGSGNPVRGARLVGTKPAPILDVTAMKEGLACRVVGTDMDMYASGPPRALSLEAKAERVKPYTKNGAVVAYEVMARTTKSTGGDGSILVCDGKLAGIHAGAGSQGTTFDFRSVDADVIEAFAKARTAALATCRRQKKCP